MPVAEGELLTIEEAARIARRHPATIWRWIGQGYMGTTKKRLDRRVYVERDQLEALVRELPAWQRDPWPLD